MRGAEARCQGVEARTGSEGGVSEDGPLFSRKLAGKEGRQLLERDTGMKEARPFSL